MLHKFIFFNDLLYILICPLKTIFDYILNNQINIYSINDSALYLIEEGIHSFLLKNKFNLPDYQQRVTLYLKLNLVALLYGISIFCTFNEQHYSLPKQSNLLNIYGIYSLFYYIFLVRKNPNYVFGIRFLRNIHHIQYFILRIISPFFFKIMKNFVQKFLFGLIFVILFYGTSYIAFNNRLNQFIFWGILSLQVLILAINKNMTYLVLGYHHPITKTSLDISKGIFTFNPSETIIGSLVYFTGLFIRNEIYLLFLYFFAAYYKFQVFFYILKHFKNYSYNGIMIGLMDGLHSLYFIYKIIKYIICL